MKFFPFLYFFLSIVLFSGCKAFETGQNSYMPMESIRQQSDTPRITESLFEAKGRTLSEESIQMLLNGKLQLSDTLRIAIFNYTPNTSNSYYKRYYGNYWNNEEYLQLQQAYMDVLVNTLEGNPRVKKNDFNAFYFGKF